MNCFSLSVSESGDKKLSPLSELSGSSFKLDIGSV